MNAPVKPAIVAFFKGKYGQSKNPDLSLVFKVYIEDLRFFCTIKCITPFFSYVKTNSTCIKSSCSSAFQMAKKHVKIQQEAMNNVNHV